MHELTDTQLIPFIKRGNEAAFREVFDRYHIQLYYIAKKYVKNTCIAEDAVQDIFIKLWEKRGNLDASKSLQGFLFTMLRNHVLNMLRDNRFEIISVVQVQMELLPNNNCTADELIYREYHDLVKEGLGELSGRKREVFELKAFNGHTNTEIAELLDINIRTVKTHYYTSSQFIRKYLKTHAGIISLILIIGSSMLIH